MDVDRIDTTAFPGHCGCGWLVCRFTRDYLLLTPDPTPLRCGYTATRTPRHGRLGCTHLPTATALRFAWITAITFAGCDLPITYRRCYCEYLTPAVASTTVDPVARTATLPFTVLIVWIAAPVTLRFAPVDYRIAGLHTFYRRYCPRHASWRYPSMVFCPVTFVCC